ncbi:MAG: hypothetical protein ACM31C_28825 [Acidobacteriota bacterium]
MRQHLAKLALACLVGGCSLLYNPSNISKQPIDGAIDAPAIDANAANLSVIAAAPSIIDEGQGDFGSRPAVLVVHGSNFVVGAQVTITAASTIHVDVDNTQVAISSAADYLAVPVTAHVDPALGETAPVPLTITVTQPANGSTVSQMLAGQVSLQGHAELDAAHLPPTDGTALAMKYSKIDLTGNDFTFTGGAGQPVLLRSVSSIAIGTITAKGKDASGTTHGVAGPGGCNGGDGSTAGDCDGGGGAGTASTVSLGSGGGGGAGFAAMGTSGNDTGHGTGGSQVGDDLIATYAGFMSNKPNHAAGGGGGGGSTLGAGGGGGGGGGLVELTAGGDVTTGVIDTSGGAGSSANGAGGGGGAGGVIVLRAGGTLTVTSGTLKALGGAAGASDAGAGSDGRIRWDAPAGGAPSAMPTPVRGPAYTTTAIAVTTAQLQLVGSPNHTFSIYWVDDAQQTHTGSMGSFGDAGTATIGPALAPGYSHVCITLTGGQQGKPEADKCIDVAYLP